MFLAKYFGMCKCKKASEGKMHHKKGFIVLARAMLGMAILFACVSTNPFPLSEPGQYDFGTKGAFDEIYSFVDTSRADRKIGIMVWYPAKLPKDAHPSDYNADAEPDLSGAPYPLILSSAKVGSIFGPHLASHGFVVVGVKGIDTFKWNHNLIDQPLDILFALDQVASQPLEGLEGMIDAEHAGTMGYSFDGYNSLAMSGARVDPEFYLAQCAKPQLEEYWIQFEYCEPAKAWAEFTAQAGDAITTSNDGLWQPMTDERIRAVIPMGPDGAQLFGERGLAFVDRPTMIICGTEDSLADYQMEAVYIYEHIGAPDKTLISFIGEDHFMIESDEPILRMKHFITAFFGYYLQGQEDYTKYFSEDFVSKHDGLAWGVYKGE
jgi:predicted dienelactone hydrolase